MKRTLLLISLLLSMHLFATTPTPDSLVSVGMTKKQVKEFLGEPRFEQSSPTTTWLTYSLSETDSIEQRFVVKLQNDTVNDTWYEQYVNTVVAPLAISQDHIISISYATSAQDSIISELPSAKVEETAFCASEHSVSALPMQYESIYKVGNHYYIGNQRISRSIYKWYLCTNCPEAYERYCSGMAMEAVGSVFFSIGTISLITGIVLDCVSVSPRRSYYVLNSHKSTIEIPMYNEDMFIAGTVLLGIGALLESISIPCIFAGNRTKNEAIQIYNICSARNESPVTMRIKTSGTGVGLAFNF